MEVNLQTVKQELVDAHKILYREGHRDKILGHVSVRIPEGTDVLIKPNGFGLEEMSVDKIIKVDMEGHRVEGEHAPHRETVLHTEIYKRRPDVNSVAHLHSPTITALGITRQSLPPINHDAVLFVDGIPFYDSPFLIMEKEDAASVAQTLGDKIAIHLCNHGVMIVGSSIAETCIRALCLEEAARALLVSSQFGTPGSISAPIARQLSKQIYTEAQIRRLWGYYRRKVE